MEITSPFITVVAVIISFSLVHLNLLFFPCLCKAGVQIASSRLFLFNTVHFPVSTALSVSHERWPAGFLLSFDF